MEGLSLSGHYDASVACRVVRKAAALPVTTTERVDVRKPDNGNASSRALRPGRALCAQLHAAGHKPAGRPQYACRERSHPGIHAIAKIYGRAFVPTLRHTRVANYLRRTPPPCGGEAGRGAQRCEASRRSVAASARNPRNPAAHDAASHIVFIHNYQSSVEAGRHRPPHMSHGRPKALCGWRRRRDTILLLGAHCAARFHGSGGRLVKSTHIYLNKGAYHRRGGPAPAMARNTVP